MNREEIETRIKEIVSEHLAVDITTLNSDTNFVDNLNADSLDIVELVMTLEEEYDIEIPDSVGQHMVTVKLVVDYIYGLNDDKQN